MLVNGSLHSLTWLHCVSPRIPPQLPSGKRDNDNPHQSPFVADFLIPTSIEFGDFPSISHVNISGSQEIVRFLVEAGNDPDSMAGLGATALHIAAERGHGALVRYLLDVGASVQKQNLRGKSALHMAALSGHLEVLRLLLAEGANG